MQENFQKKWAMFHSLKDEYDAIKGHYKSLKTGTAFKDGPAIGLSVKEILEKATD